MPEISVVILACNEEGSLERVVRETAAVLREITGTGYEIIIVNDGSTDRTAEIINRFIRDDEKLKAIHHADCLGMGASLREGYALARYEWISYLPADGQIEPRVLKMFAAAVEGVDFVVSIYVVNNRSLTRRFMSLFMRLLVFVFFGYFPRIDGTYMFKRRILDSVHLVSDSFVFNFEIVVKASRQGYTFREIGIPILPRASGTSKVANLKTIFRVFSEMVKWRVQEWRQ